jgi:hypothetical protein
MFEIVTTIFKNFAWIFFLLFIMFQNNLIGIGCFIAYLNVVDKRVYEINSLFSFEFLIPIMWSNFCFEIMLHDLCEQLNPFN